MFYLGTGEVEQVENLDIPRYYHTVHQGTVTVIIGGYDSYRKSLKDCSYFDKHNLKFNHFGDL